MTKIRKRTRHSRGNNQTTVTQINEGSGMFIGVKRKGKPVHIDFMRGIDEHDILELAKQKYPDATIEIIC